MVGTARVLPVIICCSSSYDEDLVAMIARLETIFYFELEKSCQKIARLAFMVLHKLAILAQEVGSQC
jgi:hypothetical protein